MKHTIATLLITLLTAAVSAQIVELPWVCCFNDSADIAAWTLNPGPSARTLPNAWAQSSNISFVGQNSLIVSPDGGQTVATGSNLSGLLTAYRYFCLPAGDYSLSITLNFQGGTNDGLYVCWADSALSTNSAFSQGAWVEMTALDFGTKSQNKMINRTSNGWQTFTTQFRATGQKQKLVLVWSNSGNSSFRAAVVDFIQIAKSSAPTVDLLSAEADGTSLNINWQGIPNVRWQAAYKPKESTTLITIEDSTTNSSCTIPNLTEGFYDIFVRGYSPQSQDTGLWHILNNALVLAPNERCLPFEQLDNDRLVTCYWGSYSNPKQYHGAPIDLGPENIQSRHTVITAANPGYGATDPRTGDELQLLPEGKLCAVRLGNWNSGFQAEAVNYKFEVPTDGPFSLGIDYALVFENPEHDEAPEFSITISEEGKSKNLFDDKFVCDSSAVGSSWHHYTKNNSDNWWKEWSRTEYDLTPYAGTTVNVCLTTKGCSQGGHFGYAYFALDCNRVNLPLGNQTVEAASSELCPMCSIVQQAGSGLSLNLSRNATARIFTPEGRLVSLTFLTPGDELRLPNMPGVYILTINGEAYRLFVK